MDLTTIVSRESAMDRIRADLTLFGMSKRIYLVGRVRTNSFIQIWSANKTPGRVDVERRKDQTEKITRVYGMINLLWGRKNPSGRCCCCYCCYRLVSTSNENRNEWLWLLREPKMKGQRFSKDPFPPNLADLTTLIYTLAKHTSRSKIASIAHTDCIHGWRRFSFLGKTTLRLWLQRFMAIVLKATQKAKMKPKDKQKGR